jgi:hypothetical protein
VEDINTASRRTSTCWTQRWKDFGHSQFKFVDKEAEAKGAIRGIIEDTAGYSGSRDWNQFLP